MADVILEGLLKIAPISQSNLNALQKQLDSLANKDLSIKITGFNKKTVDGIIGLNDALNKVNGSKGVAELGKIEAAANSTAIALQKLNSQAALLRSFNSRSKISFDTRDIDKALDRVEQLERKINDVSSNRGRASSGGSSRGGSSGGGGSRLVFDAFGPRRENIPPPRPPRDFSLFGGAQPGGGGGGRGGRSGGSGGLGNFNVEKYVQDVKKGVTESKKFDSSLKNIGRSARTSGSDMRSLGEESALAFRRFGAFTVAIGTFRNLSSAIRNAYNESLLFEEQITKIAQVADRSVAEIGPLREEIFRLSIEYGVAADKIAQTAITLTQAGLSTGDVKTALESLTKTELLPTFDGINNTTEASIALFSQFGVEAEELESKLDAINIVSAKFPVESADLASAIRKAGGIFKASGGDFEELLALITAVRGTTRESADSIATGLRTIFARIQRGDTIEQLERLGISLRDIETNEFVGPLKAFQRINEGIGGLESASEVSASVRELLSGVRQLSRLTPLIGDNFSKVEDVLQAIEGGQGSVTRDAAKAQDLLIRQFASLRNEFLQLVSAIQNDENFRTFAEALILIARAAIQVTDALRPVIPLLAAVGIGKAASVIGKQVGPFLGALTRNEGGFIPGRGPNKDTVLANLTKGEYVLKREAVDRLGVPFLNKLNRGFNSGGPVGFNSGGIAGFNPGGFLSSGVGRVGLFAGVTAAIAQLVAVSSKNDDSLKDNKDALDDNKSATENNTNWVQKLADNITVAAGQIVTAITLLSVAQSAGLVNKNLGRNLFGSGRRRNSRGQTLSDLKAEARQRNRVRNIRKGNISQSRGELVADGRGARLSDDFVRNSANEKQRLLNIRKTALDPGEIRSLDRKISAVDARVAGRTSQANRINQLQPGNVQNSPTRLQSANSFINRRVPGLSPSGGRLTRGFSSVVGTAAKNLKGGIGGLIGSVVLSAITPSILDGVLGSGDSQVKDVAGKGISTTASLAGVGAFFGPLGAGVGAVAGLAVTAASEFESFNTVVRGATFGLVDFKTSTEQAAARQEELAKTESLRSLNAFTKELNQTESFSGDTFNLKQTADALQAAKRAGVAQDELTKGSEALISAFERIAKTNPGKSIEQLVDEFGGADADRLFVGLNDALVDTGSSMNEFNNKTIKPITKSFQDLNKAQSDYVKNIIEANRVQSAVSSAGFGSDVISSASVANTGQFRNTDIASLFQRATSGTLGAQRGVFTGALNRVSQFGPEGTRIARGASVQSRAIESLPSAIANALDNTLSLDAFETNFARTFGKENASAVRDALVAAGGINDTTDESGIGAGQFAFANIQSEQLGKVIADVSNSFTDLQSASEIFKAIQENNGKLQDALNQRVSLENTFNASLQSARGVSFGIRGDQNRFNRNNVNERQEARFRTNAQLSDILRGTGIPGGVDANRLGSVNRQAQQRRQEIALQPIKDAADILEFNELSQTINKTTTALEFLRDSTDEAASLQEDLTELQRQQSGGRNLIEQFLTGSSGERISLTRQLASANQLQSGGSLSSIAQGDRGAALDALRSLRGEEVVNEILRRSSGSLGQQFFAPIGQTQQGQPILNSLNQVQQGRQDAGNELLKNNQAAIDSQNNNIQLLISQFQNTLNTILNQNRGGQGNAVANNIQINGQIGHTVEVRMLGGEFLANLEPTIKKYVQFKTEEVIKREFSKNGMLDAAAGVGIS